MDKETHVEGGGATARTTSSEAFLRFVEAALRVAVIAATLIAAIVMGTDKQTFSVFGVELKAKYKYSAAFVFFVVANAIASGYALLSVAITLFRPRLSAAIKFMVLFLDLVMVALVMAGASAATAIAYVGRKGSSHAQWLPICKQFDKFCDHAGGALISSFIAVIVFMLLTLMSSFSIYKHKH